MDTQVLSSSHDSPKPETKPSPCEFRSPQRQLNSKPHQTDPSAVVAGILIGGKSRRMGVCKAGLPYRGKRFVDFAIRAVWDLAEEVVLLGDAPAELSDLGQIRQIPDPVADAGPLAGLYSLLEHALDRWVLILACDLPLVDTDLLKRLLEGRRPSVDAVAFRIQSNPMQIPLCIVFHSRVRTHVEAALRGQDRSIRKLLEGRNCVWIDPDDEMMTKLGNVNTPEDYTRLIAISERNRGGRQA